MRGLLSENHLQGVQNYVYSGDVTDLDLQAEGFAELVARKAPEFFEVF